MKKTFTLALSASLLAISAASYADTMNLRFQSSDPAGSPNFELQQTWTKLVEEKTDGQIVIEMLPVDSIVAHNETQDAIASGILDGHITDVSYFSGKEPAYALIGNPVGAWSDPKQMLDFMENGGGKELMNQLNEPYGLHFIGATTPGLEAFVSSKPLDGVDDLKGLKMRAPEGLVQQVFAAAGAAPVNLPGSEVFTSLDKHVIDAADYTVFSTNQEQGMNDIAPHPVYPGFHSMPLVEVSMNLEKWNALPDDLKAAMEASVREFALTQIGIVQERDEAAVALAKEGGKITVHNWSDEERAKFREIAVGEWAKAAEKSENSKLVLDTLTTYLVSNGLLTQ